MSRSSLLSWVLLVAIAPNASSECIATGYAIGSPVPHYAVIGRRSLKPDWNVYKTRYPESHRLAFFPDLLGVKDLDNQCLIRVKPINRLDTLTTEQIIVQVSCDDLQIGQTLRLVPFNYCREYFDPKETPDFYNFLQYRLANVTSERLFPAQG